MGQKYKWTIPDVKGGPIIIQSTCHHLEEKVLVYIKSSLIGEICY